MKYSWSQVVDEFRTILIQNVSFVGQTELHTKTLNGYFAMTVRETDIFHPFNSDGELSRALDRMPKRCDYRSIKSYWAWKNGRMVVEDALFEMLQECMDDIRDHFMNGWNFPPGYRKPVEIKFGWDECDSQDLSGRSFARIVRAAQKPGLPKRP